MPEDSVYVWVSEDEFEYRYIGERIGRYDEYQLRLKGQKINDWNAAHELHESYDKFMNRHPEFEILDVSSEYIYASGCISLKHKPESVES